MAHVEPGKRVRWHESRVPAWGQGLVICALVVALAGAAAPACARPGGGIVADHSSADAVERVPVATLQRAQQLAVLFGHQSVGENILMGLQYLSRQQPDRYRLSFTRNASAAALSAARGVGDFPVGRNGQATSKFQHFQQVMEGQGFSGRVDVAMMKLCFVDFNPRSDATATFQAYRATMESLERSCPNVRFVWWTSPLTVHGNQQRHAFNQMVRQYCSSQGKILFDLADLESYGPQGTESRDGGGPCLAEAWSRDGGHLNPQGTIRVARAWWWLMARLAGWQG